jgi:hypothetical protein
MDSTQHPEPWNKGKLVGQKPPLKPKDTGQSEFSFRARIRFETWPCSTSRSIANCAVATKVTLIYKRTKNRRAVQLLRGHGELESTARHPGIEVDDALDISEQTEI